MTAISETGDETYTGYVFQAPRVEQVEVVAAVTPGGQPSVKRNAEARQVAALLESVLTGEARALAQAFLRREGSSDPTPGPCNSTDTEAQPVQCQ